MFVKHHFVSKKHCEAKTYKRLRNMLLEKGYKPLSNIIYNYSFDYKITKPSNKTKFNYPYTIYVTYPNKPTLLNQYYLAA